MKPGEGPSGGLLRLCDYEPLCGPSFQAQDSMISCQCSTLYLYYCEHERICLTRGHYTCHPNTATLALLWTMDTNKYSTFRASLSILLLLNMKIVH